MSAIIEVATASPPARWVPSTKAVDRVAESIGAMLSPMLGGDLVTRVLDEVDFGLMVLTAEARPVFANRTALRSCGANAPFRLEGGRLRAACPLDNAAFSRSMQQAVEGRRSLLTFDVPGEDGDNAYARFLAFIPLSEDGPAGGDAEAPVVLLVFGRPQVCGPLSVQFFARQHGVTLAESAVLTALCNGHTPRRIAEERGIAVSTVRTHILRIREKTGARSIMDLLRVASMLPPLVAVGS
jgi:DNA-binding CsgD family transcriptional regulator